MAAPADANIHRELRDGVPVYWTPEAPLLTGALVFRVGSADETPITRGVTHLVEHLALYGLGAKQPYGFNGFVDGSRAVFVATGTPEQVASFMTQVCVAIADLPLHRLEAECRILRTEAHGRQPGPIDVLKWNRFGARNHGLAVMHEYAFDAPDPVAVQAWASERFTAENACAWFSGPIPAGVRFDALPHGRRMLCPDATPIACLKTPAFVNELPGGIAISFVTDREAWIAICWSIATQRLHERLRHQQALTYSVQAEFHPLTANQGHSTIFAGCLDEHATAVQEGLLEVLYDFAKDGPTVEELRLLCEDHRKSVGRPETIPGSLDADAVNELLGRPVRTWQDLLQELDAKTPESCAADARAALKTAILMLPPGCARSRDSFGFYPVWSEVTVRGGRHRSVAQRFPWSKKAPQLIVGTDGVSYILPEGQAITVQYDQCAGAVLHPDGVLRVIGDDGSNIWIRAADWRNGAKARDKVLGAIPSDRLLRIQARDS